MGNGDSPQARRKRVILLASPLFLLSLCFATISFKGNLQVRADYSFYYLTDTTPYIEIFYEIPRGSLIFVKDHSSFRASYQVGIFTSPGKRELSFFHKVRKDVRLETFEETRDEKGKVCDSLLLSLPANTSRILLVFEDLNSDRSASADFLLKEKRPLFLMKGRRVTFDGNFSWEDTISFYLPLESLGPLTLSIIIKKGDKRVFTTFKKWRIADTSSREIFSLPLTEIPEIVYDTSAHYTLSLTLTGKKGAITKKDFQIFVNVSPYLSDKEWARKVSLLFPIATEEEMRNLRGLSKEERKSAWERFWVGHNEKEEDYFAKVDYCLKNFSGGDKGLLSDRAKIYLKYGPPDAIEEYPYETNRKPHYIWRYYDLGLTFLFVDFRGVGEYKLVKDFEEER